MWTLMEKSVILKICFYLKQVPLVSITEEEPHLGRGAHAWPRSAAHWPVGAEVTTEGAALTPGWMALVPGEKRQARVSFSSRWAPLGGCRGWLLTFLCAAGWGPILSLPVAAVAASLARCHPQSFMQNEKVHARLPAGRNPKRRVSVPGRESVSPRKETLWPETCSPTGAPGAWASLWCLCCARDISGWRWVRESGSVLRITLNCWH